MSRPDYSIRMLMKMAEERGMTLAEFMAEKTPERAAEENMPDALPDDADNDEKSS